MGSMQIKFIHRALSILAEHKRAYIYLNIAYYGLVILAMVYSAYDPSLSQSLSQSAVEAFTQGPLSSLGDAYGGGQILMAIVLTFVVNSILGSFISITLPSMVIPFSGLFVGAFRAVVWGLLFTPVPFEMYLLPHWLTLLIEGQAYVVTMLAAYIQGIGLVRPSTLGASSRRGGYLEGLKLTIRLYPLIAALLAIAAIYEALEVILIMPRLI
jgi:hypothetical protein